MPPDTEAERARIIQEWGTGDLHFGSAADRERAAIAIANHKAQAEDGGFVPIPRSTLTGRPLRSGA